MSWKTEVQFSRVLEKQGGSLSHEPSSLSWFLHLLVGDFRDTSDKNLCEQKTHRVVRNNLLLQKTAVLGCSCASSVYRTDVGVFWASFVVLGEVSAWWFESWQRHRNIPSDRQDRADVLFWIALLQSWFDAVLLLVLPQCGCLAGMISHSPCWDLSCLSVYRFIISIIFWLLSRASSFGCIQGRRMWKTA